MSEPLPPRVRLVVLFGGRSAEHDISRVSASHVLRAVDCDRYQVVPVGITRDGRWVLAEQAAELLGSGRAEELPEALAAAGPEVDLPAILSQPRGITGLQAGDDSLRAGEDSLQAGDDSVRAGEDSLRAGADTVATVVLPILHGPNGEDGTVQGLLELAGLPYVGAGVLGSSVSMDKVMAKTVLSSEGIPQPRWRRVDRRDADSPDLLEEITELGDVVFVKPANMGSSIGVSRVTDTADLPAALDLALRYDDVVVVEEGVNARELECGVLGNDEPRASVIGEIVPAAEFYDFEDKYVDGAAKTVVPADLPDEVTEQARALAVRTFRALRVEGMGRVDFFYEQPGRGLLVNEVNTIPGFTPISMYPMLWQASGLSYAELIDELVRLALERHSRRARLLSGP